MALLLSYAQYRKLQKGEAVLREGERCRRFFFVERGYLRTYFTKEGHTTNLRFALEGTFATNIKSFRNQTPSETTLEAGEASEVWILHLRRLLEQGNVPPQIARFVRRLYLDSLLASEAHSDMLRLSDASQRYHYLEAHHPELLQRIPLLQLASYLGLTRETLSRIRARPSASAPRL
ncbi:MAG: Crp/Fnr family transcriptional regulator [Janthinobacterium lividum]